MLGFPTEKKQKHVLICYHSKSNYFQRLEGKFILFTK